MQHGRVVGYEILVVFLFSLSNDGNGNFTIELREEEDLNMEMKFPNEVAAAPTLTKFVPARLLLGAYDTVLLIMLTMMGVWVDGWLVGKENNKKMMWSFYHGRYLSVKKLKTSHH